MNKWDRRYSQDESLMLRPLPLIEECCKGMAPARALDLACGSGRHSLYLAGLGWKVTAVDFPKSPRIAAVACCRTELENRYPPRRSRKRGIHHRA
ncbi:MAG: hypothetical protein IPL01_07580 [Acidobacteria bacterium]|nr:hypothetical protein [Acidobacteriota bacterium]